MSELKFKPCPFCGNEPSVFTSPRHKREYLTCSNNVCVLSRLSFTHGEWEFRVPDPTLRAENDRLRGRDGSAKIKLLLPTEKEPFRKVECKIVDFGVSDNIYIVECEQALGGKP